MPIGRHKVLVGLVLSAALVHLLLLLVDQTDTLGPWSYLRARLLQQERHDRTRTVNPHDRVEDKIIVVARLAKENVSWLVEDLADWQHAIYTVDAPINDSSSVLTTPLNKGHEGMAYLTYIIDNYNESLPSIVAFLHAHRDGFLQAWHVDTPLHSNVHAMQTLQLDYVKQQGYVNLRCNLNPGCKSRELSSVNEYVTRDIWQEVLGNTSTPGFSQEACGPAAVALPASTGREKMLSLTEPIVRAPCCAQFAVTREKIRRRPLQDYIVLRQWMIDTERTDAESGRIMEYLWHVIFGQSAITCPNMKTCYCNLYGRC